MNVAARYALTVLDGLLMTKPPVGWRWPLDDPTAYLTPPTPIRRSDPAAAPAASPVSGAAADSTSSGPARPAGTAGPEALDP